MGQQSLVALDTDHIKQYIFATAKLKEVRGASSLLDHLNRRMMDLVALEPEFRAQKVYANGGSGLFLVPGNAHLAREFGQRIQREYRKKSHDGASITFVVQELSSSVQDAWHDDIHETLELLHYRLAERKVSCLPERIGNEQESPPEQYSTEMLSFPSHPFMRICDGCGLHYAEGQDPSEPANYYCVVCLGKRSEDHAIKDGISKLINEHADRSTIADYTPFAWEKVIKALPGTYRIPPDTERPEDFHALRGMSDGKGYLAFIYADGNGMGQMLDKLRTLAEVRDAAQTIDTAIYEAISAAISQHLPIVPRVGSTPPRFPFDLLFIGGDDMMIVTPAAPALDIAISIAQKFYQSTRYTLSVGVVLAPVTYPFGMLHKLVEDTIQFAKKHGTKIPNKQVKESEYGETRINFMVVAGSTSQEFSAVYRALHQKHFDKKKQQETHFYATLRPYTVEELIFLLKAIREGKEKGLGRTKLHQVREAVLKMNLTTSVDEGLSVLRNWHTKQREFVTGHVYTLSGRYQAAYHDTKQPDTLFPRVTFPWFADGPTAYRTSLLDFVELYDFVM